MGQMTARERILMTLGHERADRVPTDIWIHPEVIEAFQKHFGCDDWEKIQVEQLGIEGWAWASAGLRMGDFDTRATTKWGRYGVWVDETTYEDGWGVRRRVGERGRYEEWISGPLQDAQDGGDVAGYRFPTEADVLVPADLSERVAGLKRAGQFVCSSLENAIKRLIAIRGYENALMDYADGGGVLEAVHDRLFPVYTKLAVACAKAGVDMIKVIGDVSMQDRILMGAGAWRKHDKPRYAKMIEEVRRVKKDMVFFFHSDGKLTELMDDLVEIGFSVINPIQPECMDPREVKKRWGKRITLHGCISIQKTLPFGTVREVREEVEGLIRDCGHDGGLVLMPSNVIQPDTPVENVLACFRAARDFRW